VLLIIRVDSAFMTPVTRFVAVRRRSTGQTITRTLFFPCLATGAARS